MTRLALASLIAVSALASIAQAQDGEFPQDAEAPMDEAPIDDVAPPEAAQPYEASEPASSEDVEDTGTGLRLNAGLSAGYGADMGNDDVATPFGVSLRPHLGITLPEGIYIGGVMNYSLGGSGDFYAFDQAMGQDVLVGELTLSTMFIGGEFGFDAEAGEHFVLRPTIGMGAAIVNAELCNQAGTCVEESNTYPSLQFGARFLVPFGAVYAGLDFAYLMVPNKLNVNPADQAFVGIEIGVMPDLGAY